MTKNEHYDINQINDEEEYEIRIQKRRTKEENAKKLAIHRKIKKDLMAKLPKEIDINKLEIIATAHRVLVMYIDKENHSDVIDMVGDLLHATYWDYTWDIYKEDDYHIHISIMPKSEREPRPFKGLYWGY